MREVIFMNQFIDSAELNDFQRNLNRISGKKNSKRKQKNSIDNTIYSMYNKSVRNGRL